MRVGHLPLNMAFDRWVEKGIMCTKIQKFNYLDLNGLTPLNRKFNLAKLNLQPPISFSCYI